MLSENTRGPLTTHPAAIWKPQQVADRQGRKQCFARLEIEGANPEAQSEACPTCQTSKCLQ